MDALRGFGEIGMGSRLKRTSEYLMKETQIVYNHFQVDFDPYLFPVFKIIQHKKGVTNMEIKASLKTSQPAVTQVVNKLLKKGLIRIEEDASDKRKKIIFISQKGKKLAQTLAPIWKSIEETLREYTFHSSQSLVEHLNKLDDKCNQKSFSQAIIENTQMEIKNTVEIVHYKAAYAPFFYDLNIEWLKTYFYVEPYDEEVLGNPEKYIIGKGGHIFFSKLNHAIVGTVALMPTGEANVYELTKMAVSPEFRGHKIGQKLMQYCIDFAKKQAFNKLILYSNTKLENAIYIYRKYGFVELQLETNSPYIRSDIKMELPINT